MIKDSDITNLYQKIEKMYETVYIRKSISPPHAQIFCGRMRMSEKTDPAGCDRHKLLFRTYNIIPQYCFNCYKIEIQPQTVIDLFKLLFIFKSPSFPVTNARKCFLRSDKDSASHYSGLIYFENSQEAKSILERIKYIVSTNIGENIRIFIKRGCSDYAKAHPEYAELNKDWEPTLKSNEEWKKIEEQFNKEGLANHLVPVPNDLYPKEFTFDDLLILQTWLSYARTIGDESYRKITSKTVKKIPKLNLAPFVAPGD